MIRLETERLILRDYTWQDRELYFRLKQEKQVMYYLQDIMLHSRREAEEEFASVIKDMESEQRKYYFFHMEQKHTGAQIGSAGYTVEDITPYGKLVHAGYFSYPEYWGQGYMTEAFQRILAYAFYENDVYRVSTGCLVENQGSEQVMKKCGMIKEAEHVDYEYHDGKWKTRVEYRMLRKEWEEQKNALR